MGPIWSDIEHVSNLTFTEREMVLPIVVIIVSMHNVHTMSMLCQWLKPCTFGLLTGWITMFFMSIISLKRFFKDITPMVMMNRLIYFEAAKTYTDRQHPVRASVCIGTTRIGSTIFMQKVCVKKFYLLIWTCLRKRKQLNIFLLLYYDIRKSKFIWSCLIMNNQKHFSTESYSNHVCAIRIPFNKAG